MMGAGIAYSCALAGWEVVLKDVSLDVAAKGKAYSEGLVAKGVQRGKTTPEKGAALLARITPTDDYAALAGADLVIEAVVESPTVKKDVFAEAAKVVAPDALLCSNTSTLPITSLAEGVDRPGDFIGLHFFSPVDRMPLIEIIRGRATSDATLARAFDVAVGLRKTPIVVNDSRGFFTSRVISTFLNEGVAMLAEGIDPQTIEQACAQAGYPAPVLQLIDELTLTLPRKIRDEARAAAGAAYVPHPAEAVLDRLVEEFDRTGRSAGAGFYEYENGRRTRLWPGLRSELGATNHDVDLHELAERMLVVEAVETQTLPGRGRAHQRRRRERRLGARHRLPAVDRRRRAVRRGLPGRRGRVRGPGGRLRGPLRRAVPGSCIAARSADRAYVAAGGGSPDESGTLERWRNGCSRSWTGWARSVSVS